MRTLTADLPGTGGTFKGTPEDFLVEEVPAYLPCGSGEHTFLFIEKRDLNTRDAMAVLCRAFGVSLDEAGAAGLKDRQAVTRQWLSLPRVDPAAALGQTYEGRGGGQVTVLLAERHKNKLRTGHLRKNQFTLTLRDTTCGIERARAVMAALLRGGLPNRYGEQRFGHGARNIEDGRRLVLGELRVPDRFRRRFLISAYQAALFNEYLDERHDDGTLFRVLPGDVLQKRDSGGLFTVVAERPDELAEAQTRVDRGLIAITGPIFGGRMHAPAPDSEAAAREAALLARHGLTLEHFAALRALAEGTRRPLLVPVEPPDARADVAAGADIAAAAAEADALAAMVAAHPDDAAAVVLRFALPPGTYATAVLQEVMKPSDAVVEAPAAAEESAAELSP